MTVRFWKVHGIGNDFVLIDNSDRKLAPDSLPALARTVCERKLSIGADGMLVVQSMGEPWRLEMFNPDGSEGKTCGNGLRCIYRWAQRVGPSTPELLSVELGGRVYWLSVSPEGVRVEMGTVSPSRKSIGMTGDPNDTFIESDLPFDGSKMIGTAVAIGNPHLVFFVPDVDVIDLAKIGPILENHPWFPDRTNVHFAQVIDPQHVRQRTWERGAGITLACGSGACAVAYAGFRTGRLRRIATVSLPGGDLRIEIGDGDAVSMIGSAEVVFEGVLNHP